MKRVWLLPFGSIVIGGMLFGGCGGAPPAHLGVDEGRLTPCPDSPNCVSTQATDESHRMDPLEFVGARMDTLRLIEKVIDQMVRTRVVKKTDTYLHVEFRTRLGFVDDVEFHLDSQSRLVHFRSASRLGFSDLGVNRRRMEEFRERYKGSR